MKTIIENLFGEFVDLALGIDPTTVEVSYRLIGSHSIGFWLFIGIVVAFCIGCCFSKKLRSKFF